MNRNLSDYYNKLWQCVYANRYIDPFADSETHRQFTFFCANLMRFQPDIETCHMPGMYRALRTHIALSALDQAHPSACEGLQITGLDERWINQLKAQPGLVCTFHVGSYRLIGRMLVEAGVPLAIVLAKSVLDGQQHILQRQAGHIGRGSDSELQLIDAESPGALFAMRRALAKGLNLLVYVDGNTGAGGGVQAANTLELPFLQSHIRVRKGVAALAVKTQAPIYHLYGSRPTWEQVRFKTVGPLWADRALPDKEAAAQVMAALYGVLEQAVASHPQEWEGWTYLHALPQGRTVCCRPTAYHPIKRKESLLPFRMGTDFFVLDARRCVAQQIGKWTYKEMISRQLKATLGKSCLAHLKKND